jgi:transposase
MFMTVEDLSRILGMSWGTVKEIDKSYLEAHYSRPRLKEVRYIAVDEFSVKKGHKYQTVVYDLEAGRVLYVGQGRSGESLKPFWKRLKRSGSRLKAIAIDMWPAYIESVKDHMPEVPVIYDRFHIVRKMNEALSEIRKELYRRETDVNNKKVIKGTRWILLKRNEKVRDNPLQMAKLEEALNMNAPLAKAYYLKEELNLVWNNKNKPDAQSFLEEWIDKARSLEMPPMDKFCNLLESHRDGILNWFKYPISTGPLEGFNNKIKVLKRKSYGFRDMDYFALKILALHENRYALF